MARIETRTGRSAPRTGNMIPQGGSTELPHTAPSWRTPAPIICDTGSSPARQLAAGPDLHLAARFRAQQHGSEPYHSSLRMSTPSNATCCTSAWTLEEGTMRQHSLRSGASYLVATDDHTMQRSYTSLDPSLARAGEKNGLPTALDVHTVLRGMDVWILRGQ